MNFQGFLEAIRDFHFLLIAQGILAFSELGIHLQKVHEFPRYFGPFWQKGQIIIDFGYGFPSFFGGVFRFRKSRLGVMVFQHFRESKTSSIPLVTVGKKL